MRVFVTGATGFIGSAVVKELLSHGHEVLGLVRSSDKAEALKAVGAQAHTGTLQDLPSLISGADQCDGVIHTAFIHDFSKFAENCETDRRAIEALSSVLVGKPLVVTSGTALLEPNRLAVEIDRPTGMHPRIASEQAAAAATERGVLTSIVRLPPSVHGDGKAGFVSLLIQTAVEKKLSAFVGDGMNRWPSVHYLDAARLFRLALEKRGSGVAYHGNALTGTPMRDIAEVIGRKLGCAVQSLSHEEATDHFGWFAHFAELDNPTSNDWSREHLGWNPTHQSLLEDLETGPYFETKLHSYE